MISRDFSQARAVAFLLLLLLASCQSRRRAAYGVSPQYGRSYAAPRGAPIPPNQTYRTVSAPSYLARSAVGGLYISPGDGHWVRSKSDDGEIFTLEDGSAWRVDVLDRIDAGLWLATTNITVVEQNDGYLLVNTDDSEKAHAILLHQ